MCLILYLVDIYAVGCRVAFAVAVVAVVVEDVSVYVDTFFS